MKILLIDPTCLHPSEAAKVDAFLQIPGISLQVLTGNLHVEGDRKVRISQQQQPNLHVGKVIGKFPNRTFFLSGLLRCLRQHPDVILAYSDWDHWLTLQIVIARFFSSRKSRLFIQGWENQPRSCRSHPQPNILLYCFDYWVEKIVLAAADAVMARSPEAAEVLKSRGFAKPIRVIPWGVDVELFALQPRLSSAVFTVGYVGRLVPEKGVDVLIRALAGLPNTRGIIVGSGPEREKLEALAVEKGIEIQFTGSVAQSKLPDILRQMDVLVLPSRSTHRWAEQFGRAAVEAMVSGIPVIGSNSGAIPWVIGDADLIFREDDIEDLNRLIKRLRGDSEFYQQKAIL
ncbi:MAG: glycosyltransferase, partial [bacterium]